MLPALFPSSQPPVMTSGNALEGKTLGNDKKVMLVYFIGGVSFMEIAAMRFLSKQKDFPYQIVVCTTKMINGNSFILSCVQDIQSKLQTPGGLGTSGSGSRGGATTGRRNRGGSK